MDDGVMLHVTGDSESHPSGPGIQPYPERNDHRVSVIEGRLAVMEQQVKLLASAVQWHQQALNGQHDLMAQLEQRLVEVEARHQRQEGDGK
jgi:uncharacterized coiled-coil protein SlyX